MFKTEFHIKKMDCRSEEQIIRMKLADLKQIAKLEFDIPKRRLLVFHEGDIVQIEKQIEELNFNSSIIVTEKIETYYGEQSPINESKILWYVLLINLFLFLLEITYGFISGSVGLIADSLDMLADAIVYALSLYAIGHTLNRKKQVAKISGYLQLLLAALGLLEVLKRFLGYGEVPVFQTMITISLLALIGNTASLLLLQKTKSKEAHIQASVIFTSNDVLINVGVIIAGIFVYFLKSKLPDLIVGTIVFLIVIRGAFRILKLSK